MTAIVNRLFPRQADNKFEGHKAALWLLGLFIALKLIMSVNSILNTESVAVGADGIPLDSFSAAAARLVLTLFALTALGQLTVTLIALAALIRWRALVPFVYLMLLSDQLARRFIAQAWAAPGAETTAIAWSIGLGILAILTLGLLLSLLPARAGRSAV